MKYIAPPLNFDSTGEEVANLHKALQFLIEKEIIKPSANDKAAMKSFAKEQKDQVYGKATQRVVLLFQKQNDVDERKGLVNKSTSIRMNELLKSSGAFDVPAVPDVPVDDNSSQFVVSGAVTDSNGKPQAGYIIRAYDRDLRNEQLLGKEARPDEEGKFTIKYRNEDFANADAESPAPDLVVRLFREADPEESVDKSPVRFNASRHEVVNFIIPVAGISEWERVSKAIFPLLKGQGKSQVSSHYSSVGQFDLQPYEVTDEDVDFIRQDTKLSEVEIRTWVKSVQMVREAEQSLNDEHSKEKTLVGEFGWPFFYAMIRQGLSNRLKDFLDSSSSNWHATWKVAVFHNQVPSVEDKNIEMFIAALGLIRDVHYLNPSEGVVSPLSRILSSLSTPPSRTVALDALAMVREKGMDDPDALLKLTERHPDEKSSINGLVRGLRVNKLVDGHEELFHYLSSKLEGESNSIEPLAKLGISDWANVASETSVTQDKVLSIQLNLERDHPLVAVQSRLEGDLSLPANLKKDVRQLIKTDGPKANDILLGKTPIADEPEAPGAEKLLKEMGRYVRAGLNMEFAGPLIGAGADTPALALRYGRDFIRKHLKERFPKLDLDNATNKFLNTSKRLVDAGLRFSTISLRDPKTLPTWIYEYKPPTSPGVRENLPTLSSFFGDMDECLCEPCESMLGQPAYLVDLLNLLKTCQWSGRTALDFLESRREDILNLELTCEKANKEIRHIDKVLRVLELAILPSAIPGPAALEEPVVGVYWPTSGVTPANGHFPWTLPFDLSRAELKAYMSILEISRLDLLAHDSTSTITEAERAAETLDTFSQQTSGGRSEWMLLKTKMSGTGLWEAYGLLAVVPSIADPSSGEVLSNVSAEEVLKRISFLLDRTGLNLDTFEKIIATRFMGGLTIDHREQCKTSVMRLHIPAGSGQAEIVFDKLRRFVRLRRKLSDWSIEEIDGLLEANSGLETSVTTDADRENLLIGIALIRRLSNRYQIPVSLLINVPANLGAICSALGFSANEYSLLLTLTGLNFSAAFFTWSNFELFCSTVQQIRETGLTVEQVAELMLTRQQIGTLQSTIPLPIKSDAEIRRFLAEVRQQVALLTPLVSTADLESQALERLSEPLGEVDARYVINSIVNAAARQSDPATVTRMKTLLHSVPDSDHKPGDWFPLMSEGSAEALVKVTITNNLSADERFKDLLKLLLKRRRERTLLDTVSRLTGWLGPEISPLLGNRLKLDEVSGESNLAFVLFTDERFVDPNNSGHTQALTRLEAWTDRLFRFIRLKSFLNVDLNFFDLAEKIPVGTAMGINWRDLLALRPSPAAWPSIQWSALHSFAWLRDPMRMSHETMVDLFENLSASPAPSHPLQPVANRFGMVVSTVEDMVTTVAGITDVRELRKMSQLKKVFDLLMIGSKLGVNGTQLLQLSNVRNNRQAATQAKQLAKQKIGPEHWPEEFERINDTLRTQKRDALVAYLLFHSSNLNLRTANDLYEYYFIDPLVEPCMVTKEILEATTAVQLLAYRILFGLEKNVVASPELREQWTWMRNYRVWEANRKVYLFRENYLFPELRDDKSSSFRQMESALGQGELTQDLAKEVFGQFLDDVAQMGLNQVLSVHENVVRDDQNVIKSRDLYVLGRTPNPPYVYYWRKCLDFGGTYMEWLPWQRIELDIQGDHASIFTHLGDLYMAWPVLQSKPDKNSWLLTYYWSRHDGKTWRRAEKSQNPQKELPIVAFNTTESTFSFRVHADTDHLAFVCYGAQRSEFQQLTKSQSQAEISKQYFVFEDPPVQPPEFLTSFLDKCKTPVSIAYKFAQLYSPPINSSAEAISSTVPGDTSYIGAVNEVTWEVWIKARNNSGSSGYVKINVDPNPPRGPLAFYLIAKIGIAGTWAIGVDRSVALWTVYTYSPPNPLPATTFSAAYNNGTETFFAEEQMIQSIAQGSFVKTHLVFSITPPEGKLPKLTDLGISDLSGPPQPLAKLTIMDSGTSEWVDPSGEARPRFPSLYSNYCNGTEGTINPELPTPDASGWIAPFQGSQPGKKFALGSSDVQVSAQGSPVWYYRDERASCFFDSPKAGEIVTYAASFPESNLYRIQWKEDDSVLKAQYPPVGQPTPATTFGANRLLQLNTPNDFFKEQVEGKLAFDARMPYACYNWEVFFHAPLTIADQLSKQQKFEDAEKWLRYIFDPTSGGPATDAKRFLKFRVFKELDLDKQLIDDLEALAQTAIGNQATADIASIRRIIMRWRAEPFRPFVIARGKENQVAFLWWTLFAYVENLIAWADSRYRLDTRESINEALMLYVLAQKILGRRPQQHKGKSRKTPLSYKQQQGKWDEFANFWIDAGTRGAGHIYGGGILSLQPLPIGSLYFCMPFNDKILGYWRILDDRLFNLRHCRNIEGVERMLPFIDAPIDPELLIRAVAAGLNLADVVNGLYAPPPHYRYNILAARASELVIETKALGAALLSAREKLDGEMVSQLRSSNEINLLKLVTDIKTLQIEEAESNIEALRATRKSAGARYSQYQRLLGNKDIKVPSENESAGDESMLGSVGTGLVSSRSGLGLIKEENEQYAGIEGANTWSTAAALTKTIGAGSHATASIVLAAGAEPAAKVLNAIADSSSLLGDSFSMVSQGWRTYADQQGMIAGHLRRRDEWAFQSNQALKELQQIDKQILANTIRIHITQKERDNHEVQIEQAKAIHEVMRTKFTNDQLYHWMSGQLSALYFSTYRLALDMSKRAELAAVRELGVRSLNIIKPDHWDSLRQGLLAGERLHQDLKRLEIAYIDKNQREFELTKHISLSQLDPVALLKLRFSDSCEVEVPEDFFDMDYTGHYYRRIKSVSLSLPCVAGPYTTIGCTLTLLQNSLRSEPGLLSGAYKRSPAGDNRFRDSVVPIQSIVTSSAQNDSGLFELNFRDERYVPFEGAGAISRWRIELKKSLPQFDYATISDVVLHLKYTARNGGSTMKDQAERESKERLATSATNKDVYFRTFDIRREFSTEWFRYLNGGTAAGSLVIENIQERLPYFTKSFTAKKVVSVEVIAKPKVLTEKFAVKFSSTPATTLELSNKGHYEGMIDDSKTAPSINLAKWSIEIGKKVGAGTQPITADALEEFFIVVCYTLV